VKREDEIRDKAIEQLVAKKLRDQMQPGAPGCPDAETLAAYVDGTLTARERAPWESHFAACSRCQEEVVTLVRWSEEDAPLERRVLAPARPRPFAVFRWAWATPVLLAVVVAGMWYTGEFGSRLRQTQETSVEAPSPVPAPAPPATPQAPNVPGGLSARDEVAAARKTVTEKPKATLPPQPSASANAVDLLETKGARQDAGEEGAPAPAMAKLAAPAPPAMPRVTAQAESAPLEQATGTASAIMAKPRERARMAAPGVAAGQMADLGTRATESLEIGRGGGAASNVAPAAAGREAEQAGAAQPSAPGTAGAMKERKAEFGKRHIATNLAQEALPLSRVNGWRVGPHGLIQRIDARGNWITVPSGVKADLLDISFPSPETGWAVGQGGLVIRTTDGGKTWARIPTPTREDLIKVSATSELAARIETRNHQVWETTDGGETWRRSRPE